MKNDIQFWSFLELKGLNALAEKIAEIHTNRRCIEECAEAISGFRYGETLISEEDPYLVTVVCGWTEETAYEEWQKSPVRDKQLADLAGKLKVEAKEHTFTSYHRMNQFVK
jgi:heme-degrading monooxygenase HmoA